MRKVPEHLVGHYVSTLAERLVVLTVFFMLFGMLPGAVSVMLLVLLYDAAWWYLYDRGHFDAHTD